MVISCQTCFGVRSLSGGVEDSLRPFRQRKQMVCFGGRLYYVFEPELGEGFIW